MANDLNKVLEGQYGKPLIKEINRKKELLAADEYVVAVLSALYDTFYSQIHEYLSPLKTKAAELEIREHIAFINAEILPLIENKFKHLSEKSKKYTGSKQKKINELYTEYEKLYDGYFALVAFRSLKHYALYIEQDFSEKVFEPSMHCFSGYWYYANKMVIDNDVQFIEKQCPTGYGKSISDLITMCFAYGYDINNDIIKVTGAQGNIMREFDSITTFLCSSRHARVFPYFKQFEGKKENVFEMCSLTQRAFKIRGSKRSKNLYMVSKETKINGERAKYLFLDDITQAEDAGNIKAHDTDKYKFDNVWYKRNYSLKDFHIVAGGTTYSDYDLLSYLKKTYGGERAVATKVNRFTKIAKSDAIIENGTSVFVCVPKLEIKRQNGKDFYVSTYPEKFPTAQALQMWKNDERTFMAMEQQTPLPPEDTPFYWNNLTTYEVLPPKTDKARSDCCYAALDPARKGKNYVSMPIIEIINGKHYLIDFLYELKPMEEVYQAIVSKIAQHHITQLVVEINTDTSLVNLLQKMLREQGITFCKITKIYSTQEKEVRIYNYEATIKNNIVFPAKTLYSRSSPMGTAMLHIIAFSYKRHNEYDDSIDSIALYCQQFITGEKQKNKLRIINLHRV